MSLAARIEALERALERRHGDAVPGCVVVKWERHEGRWTQTSDSGGRRLVRAPDESEDAFRERLETLINAPAGAEPCYVWISRLASESEGG